MAGSLNKFDILVKSICETREASAKSYNVLNTIGLAGASTFIILVTFLLGKNNLVLFTFIIPIIGFSIVYLLNARKLFGQGLILMYTVSLVHGSIVVYNYDSQFLELIYYIIAFMPLLPFENLATVRVLYFLGFISFNLWGLHLKNFSFFEITTWPKPTLVYFILTNTVFLILYYFLLTFKKDGLKYKDAMLQKNKEIEEQNELIKINTKMIVQYEHEKNEMELAKKQRDLESLQLNNQLKIKMKNDLVKELQKTVRKESGSSAFLQPIINKLKHQIEEEKGIDLVQENIDLIGSDFNTRIRSEFKDLTRSEVELLSLIKLGLRNKQIAIQRNTSQNTINVALHRLKERCGFTSLNELRDFVEKF